KPNPPISPTAAYSIRSISLENRHRLFWHSSPPVPGRFGGPGVSLRRHERDRTENLAAPLPARPAGLQPFPGLYPVLSDRDRPDPFAGADHPPVRTGLGRLLDRHLHATGLGEPAPVLRHVSAGSGDRLR